MQQKILKQIHKYQLILRGNGSPSQEAYQTWATVMGAHCDAFIDRVRRRKKTILDPYAATNPAEYFAVATETFFEKPRQLKKKQPELYAELQSFYQLDPASWF